VAENKALALDAVLEVIELLEELGVTYHLGGSVASSVHGVPRQTHDLDLIAELPAQAATEMAERLGGRFYVDSEMIAEAIDRCGSFNLIHLATGLKVDVFIPAETAFDRSELARSVPHRLEGLAREVLIKSAEDTVLRKLLWYRQGGEVSDRQWNDVLGVIRTQGERLDQEYLNQWAAELGLNDLLTRALELG